MLGTRQDAERQPARALGDVAARIPVKPASVVAFIVGLALLWRLAQTLSWPGYLGYDHGAYLAGLNQLLYGEYYAPTFPRPPLAPGWQLWPFLQVFSVEVGLKVWAALVSILPIPVIYLLSKQFLGKINPWFPVFTAALFAVDWWQSDMLVSGNLPVIGMALLGLAFWCVTNLAVKWSRFHTIILIGSVGLIPYINQTSAAFALVHLPVFVLALLFFLPDWQSRKAAAKRIFPVGLAAAITGLTAAPWYVNTLPGQPTMLSDCAILSYTPETTVSGFQAVLAWGFGTAVLGMRDSPAGIKALAVISMLLSVFGLFVSCDEPLANLMFRSWHYQAVPFYVMVSWVALVKMWPYFQAKGMPQRAAKLAATGTFLFMAICSQLVFLNAADRNMLPQEMVAAMNQTESEAIIATTNTLQSFWINALRQQRAPSLYWGYGAPAAYDQEFKDLLCVLNWAPECAVEQAIKRLDVDYILFNYGPFRFANNTPLYPIMAPRDGRIPWDIPDQAPWLNLVYHSGKVKMWKVEGIQYASY